MRRAFTILLTLAALHAVAQTPAQVQLYGAVADSITGKPLYDCLVGYYNLQGERLSITPVNSEGIYALFIPTGTAFELRIELENGYREMRKTVPPIAEGVAEYRLDLLLQAK